MLGDERLYNPRESVNDQTLHRAPFPLLRDTYALSAQLASNQTFAGDGNFSSYENPQHQYASPNVSAGLLNAPGFSQQFRRSQLSFASNTVATPQRNGLQPEHPFQMLAHSLQSFGNQVANSIPGSRQDGLNDGQLSMQQHMQSQQQHQTERYGSFQSNFQELLAMAYAEQNQAQRYLRYYAALMECSSIDQLSTWLPAILSDIFPVSLNDIRRPTDKPLYLCSTNTDIGAAAAQLLNARGPLFCGILKLMQNNLPGKCMLLFHCNIANIPDYVFSSVLLQKRFEKRIRRDTLGNQQQDTPFVMLNAAELYFLQFAASTISPPATAASSAPGKQSSEQRRLSVSDLTGLPSEPSLYIWLIDDYLNAFHTKIIAESDRPQFQGSMLAGTRFFSSSNQSASSDPSAIQQSAARSNTNAAVTVQEALVQEKLTFDTIDVAIRFMLAFWTRSGEVQQENNRNMAQQQRVDNNLQRFDSIRERSGFFKRNVAPVLLPTAAQIYFVREVMKFTSAWTSSIDLSNWVRPQAGGGGGSNVRSTSGLLMPSSQAAQNSLGRMDAGRAFYHDCAESFYIMLTRCVSAWSDPQTFRWVIESWLTFIQPWRYYDERGTSPASITIRTQLGTGSATSNAPSRTNLNTSDAGGPQGATSGSTLLNVKWIQYVVENLPFYTTLLGCFAERFSEDVVLLSRAEILTCVDRILRVYAQNDLVTALERATQDGIDWSRCAADKTQSKQAVDNNVGVWYDRGSAVRITDADLRYRLSTLLLAMLAVGLNATEQLKLKRQEISLRNGYRNWLQSVLYGDEHWRRVLPPGQYKELSSAVLQRNLEKCSFFINSIQRVFQVYKDQFTNDDVRACYQKYFPDCTKVDLFKLFSVESPPMQPSTAAHVPGSPNENQIINDESILANSSVKYAGIPLEYEPLGPHEADLLINMCNWAARLINQKYGKYIQSLWFGSTSGAPRFVSRLASFALKPLVEAPVDARKELRLKPVARCVYPPRICLRRMANLPLWLLMFALVLVVYALPNTRYNPLSYLNAVVVPFVIFYVYLLFDAFVPLPERDFRFDKLLQQYDDDAVAAEQQRQQQQQQSNPADAANVGLSSISGFGGMLQRPLSAADQLPDANSSVLRSRNLAAPLHELSSNTTTWNTNQPNGLRWRRRLP